MHSTIKNPKYKTNCGKKNSDDEKYDEEEFDEPHSSKKNKKLPELCIELEMAESVRNMLFSTDKCDSALLDVTVIKPSEGDEAVLKTNTMKGTQVKKMLANLDREKRDKLLLNDLFEDKAPSEDTIIKISKHSPRKRMQASSDFCYENLRERNFLKKQFHRPMKTKNNTSSSAPVDTTGRKPMYGHCYSPDVVQISPVIGETYLKPPKYTAPSEDSYSDEAPVENFKCGDHKKMQQVYAAPRTFKDLNSIITCQSMSKDDRTPCLCEHCGIASLLSETQKRPIITAPVEHVSELRRKMNRKEYKDSTKQDIRKRKQEGYACEDKNSIQAGLAHLFERIKVLEERMDIQEERAVPKDYFKRIITKVISHFSPKGSYKNDFQLRDSDSGSYIIEPRYKNNYSVNTLVVNRNTSKEKIPEKIDDAENLKKLLNNLTENMPESKKSEFAENIWKWGGEILKPGVDLKNKIMSLLDMDQDLRKKEEKEECRPKTQENSKEKKKVKNSSSNRSLPDNKDFNSEAFKNFVEAMSAKIYKSHKKALQEQDSKIRLDVTKSSAQTLSDTSLYRKPHRGDNDQKSPKKSMIPKITKKETKSNNKNTSHETTKNVNVSYLNPKLSTWQEEESQISFRLEFSDADTNTRSNGKESKNRDLEKLEFLRTLSRTKDSDKEKLWESIWAQAKSNGQTKQDKVTIQLPRRNGSDFNDMIEIEFTIGEIEYMLTKHKYADKNKSKS